jgi:hypothetical protein
LLPALLLAGQSRYRPAPEPLTITGMKPVPDHIPVVYPPYNIIELDGVDIVGDTVMVGETWYEYQHNGQIGRQIVVDDEGYIHIDWTKGEDEQSVSRHIWYNYIDPEGVQGWPYTGYAVESSQRGGFTSMVVGFDGIAFPAFHQVQATSVNGHSACATDFFAHAGAFLVYELPWYNLEDHEYIWPRIAMNQAGTMLIISVGNDPAVGQTWAIGTYDPVTFTISYTDQILTPAESNISNEAGASKISNRIGGAWCAPVDFASAGADIWAMIDDDGEDLNFDNYWNVTKFHPPDPSWLPDTLLADGDSLRAYTDCSLFFDDEDYAHIAFTTCRWLTLQGGYHVIANAFDPDDYTDCGAWNFRAQRPSLGQDPETGYLYCMYQEYDVDTTAMSQAGWPSGEIKISVSTDFGESWSVGTNITNTVTPSQAAPGSCLSEAWPCMAELVDGNCHVLYVLDYDAGANLQSEGAITLNPIIYHKVPVDLIPTTPIVENLVFHVEHMAPPLEANPDLTAQPNTCAL